MRWLCGAMMMLATTAFSQGRETIVIGTGERGGNYYAAGGAICRMINASRPSYCATVPTQGSIENIYALDLLDVDFGIVQGDVQDAAYEGAPGFEGSPYSDLRSVATIYGESLTVIARADSGIERFLDLRGRSVSAGEMGAGSRWTFLAALSASGLRGSDLASLASMTTMEAASRLCDGSIDAMALVTGHPSAVVWSLARKCPIRFVSVDPAISNAMTRLDRTYRLAWIPGTLYPFLPVTIPTVGTSATIVTLASTPARDVQAVLRAIFDDVGEFRRQQAVLDPAMPSVNDLSAPLHPAAARFYMQYGPGR